MESQQRAPRRGWSRHGVAAARCDHRRPCMSWMPQESNAAQQITLWHVKESGAANRPPAAAGGAATHASRPSTILMSVQELSTVCPASATVCGRGAGAL